MRALAIVRRLTGHHEDDCLDFVSRPFSMSGLREMRRLTTGVLTFAQHKPTLARRGVSYRVSHPLHRDPLGKLTNYLVACGNGSLPIRIGALQLFVG